LPEGNNGLDKIAWVFPAMCLIKDIYEKIKLNGSRGQGNGTADILKKIRRKTPAYSLQIFIETIWALAGIFYTEAGEKFL